LPRKSSARCSPPPASAASGTTSRTDYSASTAGAHSDLPELERLAGTIEAWWPELLRFLQTGITNAGTDATNRTMKTVARTAYGFRNLDNHCRRARFDCTRKHRRVTAC
jgi:transposase